MSPAQAQLLRDLIAADRAYRTRLAAGELVSRDDRGVEVGYINGVNPRTADTLVEAGIAEVLEIRAGQNWIFLGIYNPLD